MSKDISTILSILQQPTPSTTATADSAVAVAPCGSSFGSSAIQRYILGKVIVAVAQLHKFHPFKLMIDNMTDFVFVHLEGDPEL